MYAKDLRPGMQFRVEGDKRVHQVSELPFPCSPYTKVHVRVTEKRETHCYDRMAEVDEA